jgi:hypothetical protein
MKNTLNKILVVALVAFITSACASQDRFIVHHTNGTVLDTKTNLMWAAKTRQRRQLDRRKILLRKLRRRQFQGLATADE